MKAQIKFALVCVIASLLLVPQAYAQTSCPAGITNPLQVLVETWSFQYNGWIDAPQLPLAAAGQIVASIGTDRAGNPVGRLTITQTSNQNGSITRLEKDVGTYQIFPDCSGGTLALNVSSRPVAFDFWFHNNRTEAFMVSANTTLWGWIKKVAVAVFCTVAA